MKFFSCQITKGYSVVVSEIKNKNKKLRMVNIKLDRGNDTN